jgi:hypothetical protein
MISKSKGEYKIQTTDWYGPSMMGVRGYKVIYKSKKINDIIDFLKNEIIILKISSSIWMDDPNVTNPINDPLMHKIKSGIEDYCVVSKDKEHINKFKLKDLLSELIEILYKSPSLSKNGMIYRKYNYFDSKYTYLSIYNVDELYDVVMDRLSGLRVKFTD